MWSMIKMNDMALKHLTLFRMDIHFKNQIAIIIAKELGKGDRLYPPVGRLI